MSDAESPALPTLANPSLPAAQQFPAAVLAAGPAAQFAWDEFFAGSISNAHTRATYLHAVRRFLDWLEPQGIALAAVTPGTIRAYFNRHPGGAPTRKLHLAAIRGLFDVLVTRHVIVLNPAASVRGERYQAIEGKTPEITIEQARQLIASIKTSKAFSNETAPGEPPEEISVPCVVGLRDRAIIATLICTAARAGAVAKLRIRDLNDDGTQWSLRFEEKGGKSREIPVRHDLQRFMQEYLAAAGLHGAVPEAPLFPTAYRTSGRLTANPLTGADICRLVKRRLKDAGLPARLSPHSFRVATMTDLLMQGVPLAEVQYLAGHADPRTTRLYDRRQQRVTRSLVERISILDDDRR